MAEVLMLSNSELPQIRPRSQCPEPTPQNQRAWKCDFQVTAQVTNCLGLMGATARCRSRPLALPVGILSGTIYNPAETIAYS